MEKRFIKEFKVNEEVKSVFLLRKKNMKLTKHDKPYLEMEFVDRTGKIEGRLWDDAEKFNKLVSDGDIVYVKGSVDEYRSEKQLKVEHIEKAENRDFKFEDLVRVANNRDKLSSEVRTYLEAIKNPWISKLSNEFTSDEKLMSQFFDSPGGKSWHNAYIGGLVEHTYEVMNIADAACKLYPEVNRDITIFGAFLHDVGKIFELDSKKLEYTIEGGLVGHIAIGHRILIGKIREVADFPAELSLRLEHIVLSHHGEYEQQSPVLPKTLEATIVYHADELVSQLNAVRELKFTQLEPDKVWSNFVNIKNRKYFLKDIDTEEWTKKN